eukprot:8471555-Ditylum_brightwellii.AAC.1
MLAYAPYVDRVLQLTVMHKFDTYQRYALAYNTIVSETTDHFLNATTTSFDDINIHKDDYTKSIATLYDTMWIEKENSTTTPEQRMMPSTTKRQVLNKVTTL